MAEVNSDVWLLIHKQLGEHTDEGFVERIRMQQVCKCGDFVVPLLLPCYNGKWRIRDDIIHHIKEQRTIQVFDIDEMRWRKTVDRTTKLLTDVSHSKKVFDWIAYNSFTNKYLYHTRFFDYLLQSHSCDLNRRQVDKIGMKLDQKVRNGVIQVMSIGMVTEQTRGRSSRLAALASSDVELTMRFDAMMSTISKALRDPINAKLTTMVLKDTSISRTGFLFLADALPHCKITSLDVSCHLEHDGFDAIFKHSDTLTHLNISYCLDLSETETDELYRLMYRSKSLSSLMLLSTFLCNNDNMLLFASLVFYTNIKHLELGFLCEGSDQTACNISVGAQKCDVVRIENRIENLPRSMTGAMFKDHMQVIEADLFNAVSLTSDLEYLGKRVLLMMSPPYLSPDTGQSGDKDSKSECTKEHQDKSTHKEHQSENNTKDTNKTNEHQIKNTDDAETHTQAYAKAKTCKRQQYDRRNAYRNQLLFEHRKCKGCGTVWPAGSVKIQAFEGMQSLCWRTDRKCNTHQHFRRVFCMS